MLNQEKMLKAFQKQTQTFFDAFAHEQKVAQNFFERIAQDAQLSSKIQIFSSQFMQTGLPTWSGILNQSFFSHQSIATQDGYSVLAVDGSQIYPDRHQGVDCYLINIGSAYFKYSQKSSVNFSSEPFLFFNTENFDDHDFEATPELINCQRTEYELQTVLEMSTARLSNQVQEKVLVGSRATPLFCMFDGSLIFWHLGSPEMVVNNKFFKRYCQIMSLLRDHHIVHAGYISLPKSRELIHVLQAACLLPEYKELDIDFKGKYLVDADILAFFLQPGQRTILFENHSPIVSLYPIALRPSFFYLNTGAEIARVETPAWIAQDPELVDQLATIILDQAVKGNGYPICLAEAHEQAVIKAADRELFYMMLEKIMRDKKIRYNFSQKSMRKRVLGI